MKTLRFALISFVALVLAGCMEVEQEITINRDGSGQMKGHFALPENTYNMIKSAKQQAQTQGAEAKEDIPLTEEEIRKKFGEKKDVALTDVKVEDIDGKHHVSFTAEFKHIEALFEDSEMSNFSLTKDAAGNYTLSAGTPEKDKKPKTPEEQQMEQQMKAMMLPMLKGLKLSLKINTPSEIVTTTASDKTATSAAWAFDIDKDSSFLDDEPELKVTFRGDGVTLPEIKPKAPVVVAPEPTATPEPVAPPEPAQQQ
jgi:hypothetical protein